MSLHTNVVRTLAVTAAAIGIAAVGSASASADTIVDNGEVSSTAVAFAGCSGNVHSGTSTSGLYARASFYLPTSTRGLPCEGWLERSTDNGATWTTVSGYHRGPDTSTGWYYDGNGYLARVCVGDFLYSNSYSCGSGF